MITLGGKKIIFTTAELPMFEEYELVKSKSKSESSESSVPVGSMSEFINPNIQVDSLSSAEPLFDIDFNKMNSFAYDLCTVTSSSSPSPLDYNNESEKEIIKVVEEHGNKTPIIKEKETISQMMMKERR